MGTDLVTGLTRLRLPLESFHEWQGAGNDCGPFCVAVAANAVRGLNLRGEDVAKEMNRIRRHPTLPLPVRRLPNNPTFPWGMADQLNRFGVRARWRALASEEDLRRALAKGRIAMPITGEWKPLWAHVRLLAVEDPGRGWGFVDPAAQDGSLRFEPHDLFMRRWRNYARMIVEVLEA